MAAWRASCATFRDAYRPLHSLDHIANGHSSRVAPKAQTAAGTARRVDETALREVMLDAARKRIGNSLALGELRNGHTLITITVCGAQDSARIVAASCDIHR